MPDLSFPHILGADAAGEIAEIGEGVEGFRIGERVVPMTGYPTDEADADIHPTSAAPSFGVSGLSRPGSYAQYQEVPARWVVKDDTGLPPEQVAAVPMVALAAVRAVKGVGEAKAGDHVLITAGSSGAARSRSRSPRSWAPTLRRRPAAMRRPRRCASSALTS